MDDKNVEKLVLSGNLIVNDNKEIFLLFRKKHGFYETPGGKVKAEEGVNPKHPTIQELQTTAQRELMEEVDGIEEVTFMEFFTKVKFNVPDGRTAIANKFITKIKGKLKPNEELFDKEKSKWIHVNELKNNPLSPDLKLLLPKIEKYFKVKK